MFSIVTHCLYSFYTFLYYRANRERIVRQKVIVIDQAEETKRKEKILDLLRSLFGHVKVSSSY